jgi:hypothetical protein
MKTNWIALRDLALARCSGYCELCGLPVSDTFALHHRLLRSRGGKDEIQNLIVLHHACHNTGTNSVHSKVKDATVSGHIVPTRQDPATYPLTLAGGITVILTPEGKYEYVREANNGT